VTTLDDIRAAADRIRPVALRTPLLEIDGLSLKCENLQRTGSFKLRGAYNMVAQLPPSAQRSGVIAYSSGNHGQAVAYAAQRLGMPATIVMPETASRVKVDAARRYGAEVIFAGTTSQDRQLRAEQEAAARDLAIVPPFDHPWIVAGAGTTGLEILEQQPDVSRIWIPMGGGGQIAGVAAAVKYVRPDVRIVGVEPVGAARMTASRAAGQPVTLERTASVADGLLTLRPGDITFAHVRALVDDVVTVSDEEIVDAVRWLFDTAKLVAEPSGAAAVAAARRGKAAPGTVAIVSGGNVTPELFGRILLGTGGRSTT
jgi:threonine dehydratase